MISAGPVRALIVALMQSSYTDVATEVLEDNLTVSLNRVGGSTLRILCVSERAYSLIRVSVFRWGQGLSRE